MEIELRLLQCALTLAEHRNFARAAKILHMSQPSLSRNIQELERRLGVSLFIRNPHGVEPTGAGSILLGHADGVVERATDLVREMNLLRGLQKSELHIGAGVYPGEMFLGRAVGQLVRDHPAARLSISYDNAFQLLPRLLKREFDFSVMYVSGTDVDRQLDVTPLNPHRMFFAVRKEHPLLLHRQSVSLAQVQEYPIATTSRVPPSLIRRFRSATRQPGVNAASQSIPSVGCDSLAMIHTIVAESNAVGILPLNVLLQEIKDGTLVALPILEPWTDVPFSIARLKSRNLSPLGEKLMSLVIEADAELREWEERNMAVVLDRKSSRTKTTRSR
jgi:DNA-binding transcriptional LysR family regulator